jgi:hypothetical protein
VKGYVVFVTTLVQTHELLKAGLSRLEDTASIVLLLPGNCSSNGNGTTALPSLAAAAVWSNGWLVEAAYCLSF